MIFFILALACSDKDPGPSTDDSAPEGDADTDTDTDTDTDSDADSDSDTDAYLSVKELPETASEVELSSCYSFDEVWKDRTVNPDCAGVAGKLWLYDFETGEPVDTAMVQLYAADTTSAEVEASDETNSNGRVAIEAAACEPRTLAVEASDDLVATISQHQVLLVEEDLNLVSFSAATVASLPELLEVTLDEEKGIVMGRVVGCQRDPVRYSQVLVRGSEGILAGVDVFYFRDKFPSKEPTFTGGDGYWIAVNVPPGVKTMEAWVWDGSGYALLGRSPAEVKPAGVTLTSIYTGHQSGVFVPASCITCE